MPSAAGIPKAAGYIGLDMLARRQIRIITETDPAPTTSPLTPEPLTEKTHHQDHAGSISYTTSADVDPRVSQFSWRRAGPWAADTPVMCGLWILAREEDSIDRSFTVLVRVICRCLPAPPHRARWPDCWPCFAGVLPLPHSRPSSGWVVGLIAQTRRRTVCGMLIGAGLDQVWHHSRAHRLFTNARWSGDALGLASPI
jgi:hypothetical protein